MDNHTHLLIEPTKPHTLSKIVQSITLSHIRLYHYPAPYGVYNELCAKRMGIGDSYYQAGSYPIAGDTDLIVEGNVGIGTAAPGARLNGRLRSCGLSLQGWN